MNNFTFGGADTRRGRGGAPFAYYETIAGGMARVLAATGSAASTRT